jgi:hypothetical protein
MAAYRRYGFGEPRYLAPDLPHYLVAVDLGKRKVGVAVFWITDEEAELVQAETVLGSPMADKVYASVSGLYEEAPVLWVCEWPMKYGDRRKYHKDIESLYAVGNDLEALVGGWDEKYRPGEWKGNAPKHAHHKRLRRALKPDELETAPPDHEHDAWDAIGIGLFATNRTKRGGA